MNDEKGIEKDKGNGVLPCVSERYLLIEWIKGHPVVDGAKYADTKQELMDYCNSLPKLPKSLVEYTICRIYNVRQ